MIKLWPALFVGLLAVSLPSVSAAQERPEAVEDEGSSEDFYKAPVDDVEALSKFIVKLLSYQPKSRADALKHQQKVIPAIRGAANRMMKLEKDTNSNNFKIAESVLLQIDIQDMRTNSKVDAQPLVDRTLAFVKKAGKQPTPFEIELIKLLGETLEYSTMERLALAKELYREGGALLANSENPAIREYANHFVGIGRRLDLPGKTMKVTGTALAGDKFDLESWKGKVVLVDFWATWCGPCLAEVPNMRSNYERFHQHGFEIVGISLDKDRERLEKFLEARKLPWTIVHEKEGDGGHPMADYYGISAIPAMFLVDRDGKVISTAANGPGLTRLLEAQFPEVVERELKEAAEEAAKEAKEAAKTAAEAADKAAKAAKEAAAGGN